MRQTPVARRPARRRIDYDACCLLLAAVVRQARKDAHRDPLAVAFLQSIGAPVVVPTKVEPMRLGDVLRQTERLIRSKQGC